MSDGDLEKEPSKGLAKELRRDDGKEHEVKIRWVDPRTFPKTKGRDRPWQYDKTNYE